MEAMVTLTTRNRYLEQTLFSLGVMHLYCDKDSDGMTVWTYANNEKTRTIFEWFHEASEKRRRGEW